MTQAQPHTPKNHWPHFLTRWYRASYAGQYPHARKLFAADLGLLSGMLIITIATIGWWLYHPVTTTSLLLTVQAPTNRVKSGERIPLSFSYANITDQALNNATMHLSLPTGFIIETIKQSDGTTFETSTTDLPLGAIAAKAKGAVEVIGQFVSTPHTDVPVTVSLTFSPSDVLPRETVMVRGLITSRGSVLSATIEAPASIISPGTTPFTLTVRADGDETLHDITIPLHLPNGLLPRDIEVSTGTIQNNIWHITTLDSETTATLTARLAVQLPSSQASITMNLVPAIMVGSSTIPQTPVTHLANVVQPAIDLTAAWQGEKLWAVPGETRKLVIRLTNRGSIALMNGRLAIRIPNTDTVIVMNRTVIPALAELLPDETVEKIVDIPIQTNTMTGRDLTLPVTVSLEGNVAAAASSSYLQTVVAPTLAIGTVVTLQGETRYYTNEGDQIGRGPLPPESGKETIYWIILTIKNTSSDLQQLTATARLPDHVRWTGNSSVSKGAAPSWDEARRTITWQHPTLPAYENVHLSMEVGYTPNSNSLPTVALLTDITLQATDQYIGRRFTKTTNDLTTSLEHDERAKKRLGRP